MSHHRKFVLYSQEIKFSKIWTAMETKYKEFNVTIMFQFTKICNKSKSETGVEGGLSSFLVFMTLRKKHDISCSEFHHSWGKGRKNLGFLKKFLHNLYQFSKISNKLNNSQWIVPQYQRAVRVSPMYIGGSKSSQTGPVD